MLLREEAPREFWVTLFLLANTQLLHQMQQPQPSKKSPTSGALGGSGKILLGLQ